MVMLAKDLEDTLAAIANKAKALRDAGVTGPVAIGDIRFELAGAEPPAQVAAAPQAPDVSPIDDPDTYGGFVPTRRQPRGAPPPDNNEE